MSSTVFSGAAGVSARACDLCFVVGRALDGQGSKGLQGQVVEKRHLNSEETDSLLIDTVPAETAAPVVMSPLRHGTINDSHVEHGKRDGFLGKAFKSIGLGRFASRKERAKYEAQQLEQKSLDQQRQTQQGGVQLVSESLQLSEGILIDLNSGLTSSTEQSSAPTIACTREKEADLIAVRERVQEKAEEEKERFSIQHCNDVICSENSSVDVEREAASSSLPPPVPPPRRTQHFADIADTARASTSVASAVVVDSSIVLPPSFADSETILNPTDLVRFVKMSKLFPDHIVRRKMEVEQSIHLHSLSVFSIHFLGCGEICVSMVTRNLATATEP